MSEIDLSSPLNYGTPSSMGSIRTPRSGIRGTPLRARPDIRTDKRIRQVAVIHSQTFFGVLRCSHQWLITCHGNKSGPIPGERATLTNTLTKSRYGCNFILAPFADDTDTAAICHDALVGHQYILCNTCAYSISSLDMVPLAPSTPTPTPPLALPTPSSSLLLPTPRECELGS